MRLFVSKFVRILASALLGVVSKKNRYSRRNHDLSSTSGEDLQTRKAVRSNLATRIPKNHPAIIDEN